MRQAIYHGILVNKAFIHENYPNKFKIFDSMASGDWILYGIKIEKASIQKIIKDIQNELRSDLNFYAHLYNDKRLYIIFKRKVFKVKPHSSTWDAALDYGKTLGIPIEQLDFWPNRFQDEIHYFKDQNLE